MQKNPIPGNVLGEMPPIYSETPTRAIRDRFNLLVGGQHSRRRDEPRYIAERERLMSILVERDRQPRLDKEAKSFPQERPRTIPLRGLHIQAWKTEEIDAAVAALNGFTGYEDNLRGQATEILLGMVPEPVEAAFTALMVRTERWNEDD